MLKICLFLGLSACLVVGNPLSKIDEYDDEYEEQDVCLTTSDSEAPEQECIFPFTFNNFTYYGCPTDPNDESKRWCSTKTDENGVHIPGQWGYCSDHCCLQNKFQWASWSEWTDYCPTRDWTDTESKYGRRLRTRQSTQLVGEKKCYQEQSGVRICCDETCENVQLNRPSAYKERNWVMGPIKYN